MTAQQKIIAIIRIVCTENKISTENNIELRPSSHLRDDLQLDSLEMAELMVRLEDEFGIDVFEDGIVSTIGEIFEKITL